MKNYLKIEWSNSCDLGNIYYQGGFVNAIFLDAIIGIPEYQFEIEESENGEGVPIQNYMKLQKIYKFQTHAPQYLVDALNLMALHDIINITYTNGLYSSAVRNVSVDTEWDEDSDDCLALVTVSFQQNDQVQKNTCCDNL